MASLGADSEQSAAVSASKSNDDDVTGGSDSLGNSMDIMRGAQVSGRHVFKSKNGLTIAVTPVILDIRRLLQTSDRNTFDVIAGIPNKDLVHAVVGLYDVSLPEMTPDILYSTVCEKWARSLLLLRDVSDVLSELNRGRQAWVEQSDVSAENGQFVDVPEEDVFTPEESGPNTFDPVYSDVDEDNAEESDDEEDFSKGIYKFIKKVQERKLKRKTHKGLFTAEDIGIEDRLVACATFEKKYCKPGEKVIHLTVIATRKKFRQMGVGKYLLQQIKDPLVVGHFDVIVVHADNSAVDFFEHYGFTDDVVLNSRWHELAEQFTNCTLMCYLPPFTGQTLLGSSHTAMDVLAMEREIKQWQEKSLNSYQSHISLVTRLKHEIIHLRALVLSQQDLIGKVSTENEKLQHDKFMLEKEFLQYRLSQTTKFNYEDDEETSAEESTQYLISRLEKQLNLETRFQESSKPERPDIGEDGHSYFFAQEQNVDTYDHGKDMVDFYQVTQDFKRSLIDEDLPNTSLEVSLISKALVNASVNERYALCQQHLNDPTLTIRLYFCGTLEHPERIPEILKNGFTDSDCSHGEYGRGLYFSQFVTKAIPFSAKGKLIIADIALGNTETIIKKDVGRIAPSAGYDSAVTPGRLQTSGGDVTKCQEYVVYNVNQALPLFLIEYTSK